MDVLYDWALRIAGAADQAAAAERAKVVAWLRSAPAYLISGYSDTFAAAIEALAHYEGDATITIEGNRAWGMGAS